MIFLFFSNLFPAELSHTAFINVSSVRGVGVSGNTALIIGSGEICSADISDPKNPKELDREKIDGVGYDVEFSGHYAFIAARLAGVHIFDIKNPADLKYICTYDSIEQASGIFLHGNILLNANRTVGLDLIDVTNPEKPRFLGKIDTAEAQDVAAKDSYAYIGEHHNKALTIIDIADPANPKFIASVKVPGNAWGVVIKDNIAYVSHGHGGHGVSAVDISDPKNARILSTYNVPLKNEIRAPDCWQSAISGNKLFFANGYDGLFVLDISRPGNFELITSFHDVSFAHNLALIKDYILLADYKNGCQIIHAPGLAGPEYRETGKQPVIPVTAEKQKFLNEDGYLKFIPSGQIRCMEFDQNNIYCAAGMDGIYILERKNPEKIISHIELPGTVVYSVAVKNNAVYAGCGGRGLITVDISNPVKPVINPPIGAGKFFNDLFLSEDRLLARIDCWASVNNIDIRNPLSPKLSDQDTKISHFMLQISDQTWQNRYLAAVNQKSFIIFDAQSEQEMKIASAVQGGYEGCALYDKYLYVHSGWKKDLFVYTLENPQNPQILHEQKIESASSLRKCFFADKKLYITAESSLVVFDCSNPEAPKQIKEIRLPGSGGIFIYDRIKFMDGAYYIPAGYSGLWIFRMSK